MNNEITNEILTQQLTKEYPSRTGHRWSCDEENTLLKELNDNMKISKIAEIHNRTNGSIGSRRRKIAYKMHVDNVDICEIEQKTKLTKLQILKIISKYDNTN